MKPYRATVFVDGLPKSKTKWFGSNLRRMSIKVEKVRGVKKEEADAIMRLADAICGFVREARENKEDKFLSLYSRGVKNGFIIKI